MMGKRRYTEAEVTAALEKAQGVVWVAANILRCDRGTVLRYMERYPNCRKAVSAGRDERVDVAQAVLSRAVAKGDLAATFFTLKTLGKAKYKNSCICSPCCINSFSDKIRPWRCP